MTIWQMVVIWSVAGFFMVAIGPGMDLARMKRLTAGILVLLAGPIVWLTMAVLLVIYKRQDLRKNK